MVELQFLLVLFIIVTIIISWYTFFVNNSLNEDVGMIRRHFYDQDVRMDKLDIKDTKLNDKINALEKELSIIALSNAQKLSFKKVSYGDNVYEIVICIDDESQVIYNSNDGLTYLDNFNANNAKKIKLVLDNMGLVNILFTKNLLPVA